MLLDSNIVIYAALPEDVGVRAFIAEHLAIVSVITVIEVLGYHRLKDADRPFLERFFAAAEVLPLSDEVAQKAVQLRQTRKISLGDSIVAATALVHGRTLVTHNTADFDWIDALQLHDPLAL